MQGDDLPRPIAGAVPVPEERSDAVELPRLLRFQSARLIELVDKAAALRPVVTEEPLMIPPDIRAEPRRLDIELERAALRPPGSGKHRGKRPLQARPPAPLRHRFQPEGATPAG